MLALEMVDILDPSCSVGCSEICVVRCQTMKCHLTRRLGNDHGKLFWEVENDAAIGNNHSLHRLIRNTGLRTPRIGLVTEQSNGSLTQERQLECWAGDFEKAFGYHWDLMSLTVWIDTKSI